MEKESLEFLQAEELTLAFLDFYNQLRVDPPARMPEFTWKNQFMDEVADDRVRRRFTEVRGRSASCAQPQNAMTPTPDTQPDEELLAKAKKNIFGYLTKNRAQIVVIGNQNVGKSTFLNNLLNFTLLNTSSERETAALWMINFKKSGVQE